MGKIKKLLFLLFLAVFLFSTGMYAKHLLHSAASEVSNSLARKLTASPADDTSPATSAWSAPAPAAPGSSQWVPAPVIGDPQLNAMKEIRLDALQQVNPEVIGWIRIPGTPIDYPIVQGPDNSYYLDHTWDRKNSDAGAIFLECSNLPDMTEFHTILYGHNMSNRSMFAVLRDYGNPDFFREHPYVYLITEAGVFRWEIYSSYEADVQGSTYLLGIQQETGRQQYIDFTLDLSVFDSGIIPGVNDRILTLSTCSGMGYDTRWVVHARLPMTERTR